MKGGGGGDVLNRPHEIGLRPWLSDKTKHDGHLYFNFMRQILHRLVTNNILEAPNLKHIFPIWIIKNILALPGGGGRAKPPKVFVNNF